MQNNRSPAIKQERITTPLIDIQAILRLRVNDMLQWLPIFGLFWPKTNH